MQRNKRIEGSWPGGSTAWGLTGCQPAGDDQMLACHLLCVYMYMHRHICIIIITNISLFPFWLRKWFLSQPMCSFFFLVLFPMALEGGESKEPRGAELLLGQTAPGLNRTTQVGSPRADKCMQKVCTHTRVFSLSYAFPESIKVIGMLSTDIHRLVPRFFHLQLNNLQKVTRLPAQNISEMKRPKRVLTNKKFPTDGTCTLSFSPREYSSPFRFVPHLVVQQKYLLLFFLKPSFSKAWKKDWSQRRKSTKNSSQGLLYFPSDYFHNACHGFTNCCSLFTEDSMSPEC